MKQYIIKLHYHKVKETIVAQKIHICHEKVNTCIKKEYIHFFY